MVLLLYIKSEELRIIDRELLESSQVTPVLLSAMNPEETGVSIHKGCDERDKGGIVARVRRRLSKLFRLRGTPREN